MRSSALFVSLFTLFALTPSAFSQAATQNPDLSEIQRKLDVLTAEVEKLRSGEQEVAVTDTRAKELGLSPSAASVYRKQKGLSFAGYGEVLYENFAQRNEAGTSVNRGTTFDFVRAVFYAGYRFNDKFLFNSEVEVEHANEIWLEFAYIDYLARERPRRPAAHADGTHQ